MKESINEISNANESSKIKVYSKVAIKGFSFFFATVFGGVLLFRNLKSIGKHKDAWIVLSFSILYTALSIFVVNIPERPQTSVTYLLNLLGGYFLAEYFFKKHMGEERDYEKKKIWKPLIISILITIPLIWTMIDGY